MRTTSRRTAAALLSALLLLGATACSSDGSDGAAPPLAPGDTSADPGSGDTGSGDPGGSDPVGDLGDPCQWYTAEEMSTLVGFTVTMAAEDTPVGAECVYNSDADFTGITVRPQTAASYDQYRSGRETMDIGGPPIDHPGIGDEAWIDNDGTGGNPSVALEAKKGSTAISVQVATSGEAIPDLDASIAIVDQIAQKALGE